MPSEGRRWKFRVRHILDAVAGANAYTRGMTREIFETSMMPADAFVTKLMAIGEATRHIPQEVKDRHPEVPWRKMRALRNVIVHEYERLDLGIVWNVVQDDLPPLVPILERILDVEPGE